MGLNRTNFENISREMPNPEVVRVVTFTAKGSLFVRESALREFDGAIVELWRMLAEKLRLVYVIRSIDSEYRGAKNFFNLLSHLENGSADVIMHHMTPAMLECCKFNSVLTPPFMADGIRAGKTNR